MKYEIVTDNSDMLVLILHSRVILISRDMSDILSKIGEIHKEYKDKNEILLKEAEILTDSIKVQEETMTKRVKDLKDRRDKLRESSKGDNKPDVHSLGSLFNL